MWHPIDEAEACSEQAAFIEYLRATRRWDTLDPVGLEVWKRVDPADFEAAYGNFLGRAPPDTPP